MRKIWNVITATKNALGNLLFLGIIAFILFAVFTSDTQSVPESAVMIINPEGVIVEQTRTVDPVEQFIGGNNQVAQETLGRDLVEAIDLAANDKRIDAIALDLSNLTGSTLTQFDDIGEALNRFKAEGKPVYAFGDGYSQSQYYLATFADKIYIDKDALPTLGGVFLPGFGSYPLYLKSALDKLRVSMHVIKAGTYKDAAEIFVRDDMSELSRESNQALVDFLWDSYLAQIANARDLPRDSLNEYVNRYGPLLLEADSDPAQLAIDQGLVDNLLSRSEWRQEMQSIVGTEGDSYHHVTYRAYLSSVRPPIPVINPTTDKIAVIVAKGTILDGEQDAGDIGGDSLARLIRQARNSDAIKAIVLRVDSPGGSSSASELIRSELAETQAAGKPVVTSMGGYAASGGYWIASTSNKIFASETTITGSIGVFATFPTFERTMDYLGVNSDGVGTTPLSDAFNVFSEINPMFEMTLQGSVNRTYQKFLTLVSDGRGLTLEEADSVAQGRVWSGTKALEHGLIDAIGGVDEAVASAAVLADLSDYDVVYLEQELSPKDQIIRQILQSTLSALPALETNLFAVIPADLRALAELTKTPSLLMQCVNCKVTF